MRFFNKNRFIPCVTYRIKSIFKEKKAEWSTFPCFLTTLRIHSPSATWLGTPCRSLIPETRLQPGINLGQPRTSVFSQSGPHTCPPPPAQASSLPGLNSAPASLPRLCQAGRAHPLQLRWPSSLDLHHKPCPRSWQLPLGPRRQWPHPPHSPPALHTAPGPHTAPGVQWASVLWSQTDWVQEAPLWTTKNTRTGIHRFHDLFQSQPAGSSHRAVRPLPSGALLVLQKMGPARDPPDHERAIL